MENIQYIILAGLLAASIFITGCVSENQNSSIITENGEYLSYDNDIRFIYNCSSNGTIDSGSANHNMSYRFYNDGECIYNGTLNVLKIDLPDPQPGNESFRYSINLTTDEPGTVLKAYIAEKLTLTKYYSESSSTGEGKKTAEYDSYAGYNAETGISTITVPTWNIIFDDSDIYVGQSEASYIKSDSEKSNILYSYWPVSITYNSEVETDNSFTADEGNSAGTGEKIITLKNTGQINDAISQYRNYYMIITGEPDSPDRCGSDGTVSLKGHLKIERLKQDR